MRDKKIHYVYLITNLINGKQYIGDRSCECFPEKDLYFGSGVNIKKALKKYGRENFQKEILEVFNSREEAHKAEEKYIKIYKTHFLNGGYNISLKGGDSCNSKKSLIKRSLSQKGKKIPDDRKKRMSKTRKIKKLALGCNNGMFGKSHSLESKYKMSITKKKIGSAKGKNNSQFDNTIYKFRNELSGEIFEGYKFDLANKIGSRSSDLNAIIKGYRNHHKYWIVI